MTIIDNIWKTLTRHNFSLLTNSRFNNNVT